MEERGNYNDRWITHYKNGVHPWHIPGVNPYLKMFFERLTGGEPLEGKRILIPLCGKCVDLKFFYEQGLTVVGIDLSEIAIKSFFKENDLSYDVNRREEGSFSYKIYRHDEHLSIIEGDLFRINLDILSDPFDFWWDVGALVAMRVQDQQMYLNHIISLLKPKARGLMECFEYDTNIYKGPPNNITYEDLSKLIQSRFTIEELTRNKEDDLPKEYTARIGHVAIHVLYLLHR